MNTPRIGCWASLRCTESLLAAFSVMIRMYSPRLPRNALLAWINDFLCTSYTRLEDASNGSFLFPLVSPARCGSLPTPRRYLSTYNRAATPFYA